MKRESCMSYRDNGLCCSKGRNSRRRLRMCNYVKCNLEPGKDLECKFGVSKYKEGRGWDPKWKRDRANRGSSYYGQS